MDYPRFTAEWFSAVGTVGAFAAAFWSLSLQRKELSDQRVLMEREEQTRRVAQASGVFAMLNLRGPAMQVIDVFNTSAEPVYDVRISAVDKSGALILMGRVPTHAPGGTATIPLAEGAPGIPKLAHLPTEFKLTFRDAAGRHWVRDPDGRLYEAGD